MRVSVPCAGQALDKDAILAHPCDVLIPAAIGGVLDETTAKDVQVSLVSRPARFHAGAFNSLNPFRTVQVCRCGWLRAGPRGTPVPNMP